METMRYTVRIAIAAMLAIFAVELYTAERIGVRSGATFVNGAAYAPGRFPGDGRTK